MERKYPFCVGTDSSEERVREYYNCLRRMARFGRIAERALKDIREKGSCERNVPVIGRVSRGGYGGNVHLVSFPTFVPVSRETVPDYGRWDVRMGKTVKGEHGGQETREIQIWLHANAWSQADDAWVRRGQHVGNARLKKNGEVVFVSNLHDGIRQETVSKLYRSPSNSQHAVEAYQNIAVAMAHRLVWFYKADDVPQPVRDVRSLLPGWLVEDGHVQAFCRTVRDEANVAAVLNA